NFGFVGHRQTSDSSVVWFRNSHGGLAATMLRISEPRHWRRVGRIQRSMVARPRPMFSLPWRSPMTGSRITPTVLCVAALVLADSAGPVLAKAVISIDKSTQQMSVLVDGVPRYRFAVSTGRAGYSTPNGSYRPQWLARSWFSKKYYNSPMPHSIFF